MHSIWDSDALRIEVLKSCKFESHCSQYVAHVYVHVEVICSVQKDQMITVMEHVESAHIR